MRIAKKSLISLISLSLIITLIIVSPIKKLIDLRKIKDNNWLIIDEQWPREKDITIISSADITSLELDNLIWALREMNPSVLAINLCGSSVQSSDSLIGNWIDQGVIITDCDGIALESSYISSEPVVKRFSTINPEKSFELEILKNYSLQVLNTLLSRKQDFELINFRTASQFFNEFDYESIQKELFSKKEIESKIVLIGYLGKIVLDFGQETDSVNSFRTPVNRSLWRPDQNRMFGIEISANIIQMALDSNFLDEFPDMLYYAIFAGILVIYPLVLFRIPTMLYWIVAFLLYFLMILGELYFATYLLSKQNLLIDPIPYQVPCILISIGIFIYKLVKN